MFHPLVTCDRHGLVAVQRRTEDGRWTQTAELVRNGFWPTWHPDGDRLAVSVLKTAGTPSSTLEVFTADGQHRSTLHRPSGPVAVIAPRVPHYAMWSPDGRFLSFVAPAAGGMTLFVSETDGAALSRPLSTAAPMFFAWSPDGSRLALHAGSTVSTIDIEGEREVREIADGGTFRAPAYTADGGTLVFASQGSGATRVLVQPGERSAHEVAAFTGGVAFAFRPGTRELAIGVSEEAGSGVLDHLWVAETTNDAPVRPLADGPLHAFFWAPTGERLAIVMPAQTGDGRFFVRVLDSDGRVHAQSQAFVPSSDMRTMFTFFDQYAKSHAIWSPDGTHLVLAGRLGGDEVSQSFGDPAGPYVFVWETEPGKPMERVCAGEIGFFPPRQ